MVPIVRLVCTVAVALAIGLMFAAPAASDPPTPPEIPSASLNLADTSWRFVEVLGAVPPDAVEATLALSSRGTATGRSGCNLFNGRYTATDSTLTFADLGYTKMACPPQSMTTERAVQSVLDRTSGGTITAAGELHLLASDGTLLARLVPAPPAERP